MKILNFSKKILLAAMVACTVIGCALAFNGKTVKADEMPDTATIVATEYPSLKLNEDGGMRFVIKMNAAAKTYIVGNDDISLVAYIGPVKLFEKTDAEIKETAIRCLLDKDKFYQKTGETDGSWYANACVVKMKDENLAVNYTVKVFVEKTDGTIIKTFAAGEGVRGNIYNIATRALLDETEDYTDKILGLNAYNWLGSEKLPLEIDTLAKYNALVNKVNGGANFADKYIEVYSGIPTAGRETFADGKELPNLTEYSFVTFLGEDGSELAKVKVKSGATAEYSGETPTKAEDENYSYSFAKWVTEQGGETAADLTNITADKTVYASFDKKGKNSITEFAVEDINYGVTPAFTATAQHGTAVIAYSKTEDGTFVSWDELENHDAGTYFVKAFVTETAEYAGAEQVKSFTVKKITNNEVTISVSSEVDCNKAPEISVNAKYGDAQLLYSETADGEFKEITDTTVFGLGKTYFVKAVVADTVNYNGVESEVKSFLKKNHNYNENGKCTVCGNYNTAGVTYAYNSTQQVYYVTGAVATDITQVVVLPAYSDGTNPEKPVTYVAHSAFADKYTALKKVVLPESVTDLGGSCFRGCSALEFVSMPGVKSLTYSVENRPDGKNDCNNNFLWCAELKFVVVAENFSTNVQQFTDGTKVERIDNPVLNFFVNGTEGTLKLEGINNLWTGKTFYKGDGGKCGQWSYNEDGTIKFTEHNFVDGICEHCGLYSEEKTQGVKYEYSASNDCYYVGLNQSLNLTEVTILGTYNDGVNGEKSVKYVGVKAFKENPYITKITLPTTVDSIEGSAFLGCSNLEYVSMVGVKTMNWGSVYNKENGDNNFRHCYKLKYVIIGTSLSSDCGHFNTDDNKVPAELLLSFYVEGESATINLGGSNNLWTGKVFYKGDATKCGQWNYDENGNVKSTSHNYVDGVCEHCGDVQSKSVTYAYDTTSETYYVTGVAAGTAETELYIRAKYNDGTNGDAAVTFVKSGAFMNNNNITKVIFPESVSQLDGNVFNSCANLEYVSMKGVANLALTTWDKLDHYKTVYVSGNDYTSNNFLNCGKLTTVVVGKSFNCDPQMFKIHNADSLTACVNIYVDGGESESTVVLSDEQNQLLTGTIYYYSESQKANCWHYVNGVATLWA